MLMRRRCKRHGRMRGRIGMTFWNALVLGLLLGSGVQTLMAREWVRRLPGEPGYGALVAATPISVPSVMCTSCAAPVAVGPRRVAPSTR
jgi:uncharacterized protein